MEKFDFHGITLNWLNGGDTYMDGGAMFGVVPKALWSRKYPVNDKNQIELRCDPILIQHDGQNILIESGAGTDKLSEKQLRNYGVTDHSKIEDSLEPFGLTPADIDIVLMTHMHFDHAGGLTKKEGDSYVPAFPNAEIHVSETEWNEMRHPNIRSRNTYWKENWEPIQDQVVPFNGTFRLNDHIEMIHTGGHSDGHAVIKITAGDDTLIHMADLMPTHAHQNPLWVLAYDDYPMTSVFAKEKLMKEALAGGWYFSFYHDGHYRVIRWSEDGKEIIESVKRKELEL
ncbi:YtnP family quorum-quenching lactonase [Indiicoccus explosivorum]|uniref:YtnP family quorum-quenching lactonase n=1 Tax=Indiicoccus explosivorum TaxID=1917864 RepID=UPI000B43D3AC|nr:MBL fold metallo-hydrolase [Indiicoccus explosivorum]